MSTSLLPYIGFLEAYPHPAFVLSSLRQDNRSSIRLEPLQVNAAFRSLFHGPDATTPGSQPNLLNAVQGLEEVLRLGEWLERGEIDPTVTHTLTVRPTWLPADHPLVQLDLAQTRIDNLIVCTSIPRSRLPQYIAPGRIRSKQSMKLHDFPFPTFVPASPYFTSKSHHTSSSGSSKSSRLPSPSRVSGEMKRRIEEYPWHLTSLGEKSSWPPSLNIATAFVLANPYPTALFWGEDAVLLYNDAYAAMSGGNHPEIFAQTGHVVWGELWETLGPMAREVYAGKAIAKQDDLSFFDRLTDARLPEERYYSWTWIPIVREDGRVGGIINNTFETTAKVIGARRLRCLQEFGERSALARTAQEYAITLLDSLAGNALDIPFAAFYLCSTEAAGKHKTTTPHSYIPPPAQSPTRVSLRLAGTIGIPENHPSTPGNLELLLDPLTFEPLLPTKLTTLSSLLVESSSADIKGFSSLPSASETPAETLQTAERQYTSVPWSFSDAFRSSRVIHVEHLSPDIVEGFENRGWGEPARSAVIIPIAANHEDLPKAILILGLNTRRPYDSDYKTWIDVSRQSMSASLTAVLGREGEVKKTNQLSDLDAAKTNFYSNASHELRTPLTLIAGPIQDVIADLPDSKNKNRLTLAARNVTRLSRLVDSLMDFSKLEAGKLEGHFRPVHLGNYTADLASLFRSTIEKNGLKFIVNCETQQRLAYIDPEMWEKIVFNLIGNAFKYTLIGSITVTVAFTNEYVEFSVEDTGVGIPQEDLPKVFTRFHRAHSMSRSHEGTGIGLALTKELVRLHGGKLFVNSKTETESDNGSHGTCFTVTIPFGKAHIHPSNIMEGFSDLTNRNYAQWVIEEASMWQGVTSGSDKTPSDSSDSGRSEGKSLDTSLFFEKKDLILLVDDNMDMRKYLRSILERYCTIVEAANGLEALEIAKTRRPDLVLTDVMMPRLDGFGLLKALRALPETELVPVILVTAKAGDEARVEGLLSGADDYLSKPFRSRELIARVHLHMQIGKRKAEMQTLFEARTQELRILSDLSPVGIYRANAQGRIIYTNLRWTQLSGHHPPLLIDDWLESVHPDDLPGVQLAWNHAFENRTRAAIDFRWKNGRFTQGRIEPLGDTSAGWGGIIGTITDLTDRKRYEEAQVAHLKEREDVARKRAEEADERRRGQELLIDVTSHELRQPVSAILNCSSIVRQNYGGLRDELRECLANHTTFTPTAEVMAVADEDIEALDAIYQCALSQERIANDVLSLSRIQLDVLSIHPVEFHLVGQVKGILSMFKYELKMKEIRLDLLFSEQISRLQIKYIKSDKMRFGQVITNLISNAIKFTEPAPSKHIEVTVDVSFSPPVDSSCLPPPPPEVLPPLAPEPRPVYIFVSVKDSGVGLKPDDLSLLFQRFQQGSNSHEVFGGSGLGLFVSRRLCDLLGGRIEVDSLYGSGATFRFFIQALTASSAMSPDSTTPSPAAIDRPRNKDNHRKLEQEAILEASPRPLHILITEDNMINRTVLNRQLKKAGCTTALASHGLEALEQLRSLSHQGQANEDLPRRFDAVLMDCEMPVMDGLTAVREIRRLEAIGELAPRNYIIAITGNARAGQVESARDSGMDDVVMKPYDFEKLLQKIKDAQDSTL